MNNNFVISCVPQWYFLLIHKYFCKYIILRALFYYVTVNAIKWSLKALV